MLIMQPMHAYLFVHIVDARSIRNRTYSVKAPCISSESGHPWTGLCLGRVYSMLLTLTMLGQTRACIGYKGACTGLVCSCSFVFRRAHLLPVRYRVSFGCYLNERARLSTSATHNERPKLAQALATMMHKVAVVTKNHICTMLLLGFILLITITDTSCANIRWFH